MQPKFIDIHTHRIQNDDVVSIWNVEIGKNKLFEQGSNFSAGIHPWYIQNVSAQMEELLELVKEPHCVAIGECGLDTYAASSMSLQEEVFVQHIAIAEKEQKPMLIHCVKAHQEIIKLKSKIQPKMGWIIHGYNKGEHLAASLWKEGINLSFGIAYLSTPNGKKTLTSAPLNKVFFETDNQQDVAIDEVYQLAAEILEIPVEQLKDRIFSNFQNVFHLINVS